jgi:hypothetical protein
MSLVEVTLICVECGKRSDPIEGRHIDRYEWHDAPDDGIDISVPRPWVLNLDPFGDGPGYVLCPEHEHLAPTKAKASRDAWKDRVEPGWRKREAQTNG